MFKKKGILNATSNVCLVGLMIVSVMALTGIIGCSDSGGKSRPEYQLTGYNGIANTESSALTAASNSGLKFYASAPWFANVTFQVYGKDGVGVSDLLAEDFNVLEDGVKIDPISSELNIRKRDSLPSGYSYALKTVLMVDNSPSSSTDFNKMLDSAQVVVDAIDEKLQQQIALVAYDEAGDPVLIQDFTASVTELTKYLTVDGPNAIKPSYGTTNFYGAVKFALSLWEDNPSPASTALVQGFLVAITDGNDTSGLLDVDEAIAARGDKQVFTVSVGADFPQTVVADLELLGNAGYYPVPNPGIEPDEKAGKKPKDENLCEWMLVIQNRMLAFADGFYWLQYKSEKTSADTNTNHSVEVSIVNNGNTQADAVVQGSFSSSDFLSGVRGIYFDATAAEPSGITEKEIIIERGQAAGSVKENVTAITYSRTDKDPSEFTWSSADSDILSIAPKSNDSATGVITALKPGETQVTVTDTANGVSAILIVKVVVREFSFEIVQHELESAPPWFVDATFQVRETGPTDNQWNWITDLKREELTVLENKGTSNENLVDLEKSEINLRKRDRLPSSFSYTLKTVLMIDNSPSQDEDTLDLIKSAAKSFVYRALVNNPYDNTDKGPLLDAAGDFQQEISVRSFTEDGDTVLIQDFTSNIGMLEAAIDSIPRGFGPINFYRGMMESLFMWDNDQAVRDGNNQLQQGVVIVLTDGWDSSGFYDKEAVLGEIGDKQVICVGVADDLASQANINDLRDFGNAGYYSVPDPGETIIQTLIADSGNPPPTIKETITLLQQNLRHIQDEVVDYANSFYWLNYKSYIDPAGNCADTANLDVFIKNNSNETNNEIAGEFETCQFFDGIDGMIYVNSTVTNPWGEDGPITLKFDSTRIFLDPTYYLDAVTYNPEADPFYVWDSSNNNIINVIVDENSYANSRAILRLPQNPHSGSALISIEDTENLSLKQLVVNVEEIVLPMPIAYYPFIGNANDKTGNGYDGTVYGATLTKDRNGNANSAYFFNGISDYIALDMFYGPDGAASTLNEVSVAAWVKFTGTTRQSIISFNSVSEYYGLWADYSKYENLNAVSWATSSSGEYNQILSSQSYHDNEWHFIVGTYSTITDTNNLYIDDELIVSETAHGILDGDKNYGYIGNSPKFQAANDAFNKSPSKEDLFNGVIDEVIVFHDALTAEQVHFLYDITHPQE